MKYHFSFNKTILTALLIFIAAGGFAALSSKKAYRVQPAEISSEPLTGPFAYAFKKDLELGSPQDFYIDGAFLLMQAREDGLEYAVVNTNANGTSGNRFPLTGGNVESYNGNHHAGKWNPGFRVGVGFYMPHDNWNIDAKWTYIHFREDQNICVQGTGVALPIWLGAHVTLLGNNKDASARWKGNLNTLDIRLGKPYHVSYYFVLNPHCGLRAVWIGQNYTANYGASIGTTGHSSSTGAEMDAANDYWGIGTRAGVESEWLMGRGWIIFGNISTSILFGKFNIKQKTNTTYGLYQIERRYFNNIPNFEMAMGLAWGQYFKQNRYHITLKAAYEFHNWRDMNQLRRFFNKDIYDTTDVSTPMANDTVSRGDLKFNGFAFKLLFDF